VTLTARPATTADVEAICRVYDDGIADRASTFTTEPSEPAEVREWFAAGTPIVVGVDGDRVVAFASSSPWRQRAWAKGIVEVMVYVDREHRGSGAGRVVLAALMREAEQAGLRKVFAGIFSDNHASRALFVRAGFREVGVYERQGFLGGRWRDIVLYEKLLPARVIFACVHNAGRSQMAAALFNSVADPRAASALSAGTQPAERVHPEVVAAMRELDLDLSAAVPRKLTADLARGASLLITMGCGDECPAVPGVRRDDWPLLDPKGKSVEQVREIRDEILRRVLALVSAEGWRSTGAG
jgi:arsenate reductase